MIIGKAVDTIGFSTVDVERWATSKTPASTWQTKLLQGSSQTNAALQGGSIQFGTLSSTALLLRPATASSCAVTSLTTACPCKSWSTTAGRRVNTSTRPSHSTADGDLAVAKDAAISSTGSRFSADAQPERRLPGAVHFVTVGMTRCRGRIGT